MAGYGTWEALLALASLASIFQAAISGTLVWRVSEAYGRGDMARSDGLPVWAPARPGRLFVLLWPLAWFLREPVVRFLGVPPEARQVASQMFPVVAGLILLGGFSQTLEAVVSGCQRTGLVNVVVGAGTDPELLGRHLL